MKKNKIIKVLAILLIVLYLYNCVFINYAFAADPALITKLKSAFEKIESYILKLATPIAAIAIGSGAIMKKFSFR